MNRSLEILEFQSYIQNKQLPTVLKNNIKKYKYLKTFWEKYKNTQALSQLLFYLKIKKMYDIRDKHILILKEEVKDFIYDFNLCLVKKFNEDNIINFLEYIDEVYDDAYGILESGYYTIPRNFSDTLVHTQTLSKEYGTKYKVVQIDVIDRIINVYRTMENLLSKYDKKYIDLKQKKESHILFDIKSEITFDEFYQKLLEKNIIKKEEKQT
ncbi:MAG: hypothetical protein ACOCQD_04750 [archaeon]